MERSGVGEQIRTSIKQLTAWLLLAAALVSTISNSETVSIAFATSDKTRMQRLWLNRSLKIIMGDDAGSIG